MCEPISIISAIGAGVSAVSTIVGGVASNNAAKFNSQVQRNNAVIARNAAKQEEAKGNLDIVRSQRRVAQVFGEQKVNFAASGVELASGSPLEVLVSTVEQGELDSQIIRSNSDQRAQDLRFGADNLDAQSVFTEQAGRGALIGSALGAGGSLLGAASQTSNLFKSQVKPKNISGGKR